MTTNEPTTEQLNDVLYGCIEHPDHLDAHHTYIVGQVGPKRLAKLRLVASASGLYVLNLLSVLSPKHITIVDENPAELMMFSMMRRVIGRSKTPEEWMRRIREGDYAVTSPAEEVLRKTLGCRARGGRITARKGASLRRSWALALSNYDALRACLQAATIVTKRISVTDPRFKATLLKRRNTWLYLGCLHQTIRADSFEFQHPENIVLMFANPTKVDKRAILDLRPYSGSTESLTIYCKNARRTSNPVWYRDDADEPGRAVRLDLHPMDRFEHLDYDDAAPMYREIAEVVKRYPYRKILEVGCRHGRVIEFLDQEYQFFGFDIVDAAIARAKRYVAKNAPDCDFKFVVGDWDNPPDADAEVIIFGGVFYYIEDHLEFLQKYIDKYDPKLVIISEPHVTDLSSIDAVYPRTDKRTVSMNIKRGRRVVHTFPIENKASAKGSKRRSRRARA